MAFILISQVLLLSLCVTAALAITAPPCSASFNNATQLETPCYKVVHQATTKDGLPLELRRYSGSEAIVAASNASAEITVYQEALTMTAYYLIEYLKGPGNVQNKSLLTSRTVPLTLHPPTPSRNFWLGRMALAPSKWPAHSTPPAPVKNELLDIAPLGKGTFLLASVRKQYQETPQPSDFDALCATLTSNLGLLGATLDPSSIYSPAHAYYFGFENLGADDAECWLGVTAA